MWFHTFSYLILLHNIKDHACDLYYSCQMQFTTLLTPTQSNASPHSPCLNRHTHFHLLHHWPVIDQLPPLRLAFFYSHVLTALAPWLNSRYQPHKIIITCSPHPVPKGFKAPFNSPSQAWGSVPRFHFLLLLKLYVFELFISFLLFTPNHKNTGF